MPKTYPRPPAFELFFAPLQVCMNPSEYECVQSAYVASKYGHAGQMREDGSRYFDHPKAAAWIYIYELGGRDPRIIMGLLLHDISEDTRLLSPYRISLNFGQEVALDVRAMTKLPSGKETLGDYITRVVERGPYAMLAKCCDRLHNLRTLRARPPRKRTQQIAETRKYYFGRIIPALSRCGEPWSAYAKALRQKMLEAIAHCA